MNKYKLLKEIEPGESLPIGSMLDIEGKYCTLDNDDKIPLDWLITHGYLEPVKDKHEEFMDEIRGAMSLHPDIKVNSLGYEIIRQSIKEHFPEQEMVIDMHDYRNWYDEKQQGEDIPYNYDLKDYLREKGFTIC